MITDIDGKYTMGLQRPGPLQKGSGVQTLFDLGGGSAKKGLAGWGRNGSGFSRPLPFVNAAKGFGVFDLHQCRTHTSVATFQGPTFPDRL